MTPLPTTLLAFLASWRRDSAFRRAALGAAAVVAAGAGLACGSEVPRYASDAAFTADPPRPGPLRGKMIATNSGDDTLSVVDLDLQQQLWRVPVGFIPVELEGPHHISAAPDGRFVFVNLSEAVAGSGGGPHGAHGTGVLPGFLLKIDTVDGRVAGNVQVDPNPGDNVVSADGSTIYVSHYDIVKWAHHAAHPDQFRMADSNVFVIDAATLAIRKRVPVCPAGHGMRLSADETRLYVTCGPDEIGVVHLDDPAFSVERVLSPGQVEGGGCNECPYALGVAPDGTVWVSSTGTNSTTSGGGNIRIYDPALGAFDTQRRFRFCGRAVFSAFAQDPATPGDYRAYVPEQGLCGDRIRIFAPGGPGVAPVPDGEIVLPTSQCVNAHAVTISGDQRRAYLVCEGDHVGPGTLVTIDLATRAIVGTVTLGVFPDGLALVPQ